VRGFFKKAKHLFCLALPFQPQQRGSMPNDNLSLGIEEKLLSITENEEHITMFFLSRSRNTDIIIKRPREI
jgi:hypothetical protein